MKLTINFTLKSVASDKKPIMALLSFGDKEFNIKKQKFDYKPLPYYTGVTVKKTEWDNSRKLPFEKSKQLAIENMAERITEIFKYLSADKDFIITKDSLKAELDEKLKGKKNKVVVKVGIVDFINTDILTSTSLSEDTISNYRTLKNKIIAFEKKLGKELNSTNYDKDMYLLFMEEVRNSLGKQNSVWKVFKDLRATIRRINAKHKLQLFVPVLKLSETESVAPVKVDKIHLNFEQIKIVLDYKPETEDLRDTRIKLLGLLFTGCRYSDVDKVEKLFRYNEGGISFSYARFFTQKGDNEVLIPILKPLEKAIQENGGFGKKMSEQKFNDNLKILIQKCGLTAETTLSFTNAKGKKQFDVKQFHEFVSSHIGRRSFITNLINYIPITILTKITGHKIADDSVIFDYNQISLLENGKQFVQELARLRKSNKKYFIFDLV